MRVVVAGVSPVWGVLVLTPIAAGGGTTGQWGRWQEWGQLLQQQCTQHRTYRITLPSDQDTARARARARARTSAADH